MDEREVQQTRRVSKMRFFFNILGVFFGGVSLAGGFFFVTLFSSFVRSASSSTHLTLPPRFATAIGIFCMTVVGTYIDLLYRISRDDYDNLWVRLLSPAHGGNLMFIPVWLIGPMLFAWSLLWRY